MELSKALKFLQHFSLITVGDNKLPNFSWKKCQTEKLTVEKFTYQFNYSGGYKYTDDDNLTHEIPPTKNIGIVTGFNHEECFDIDLKVFSTAQEKKDFWNEYYQLLCDNIIDFEEKFAIYKTQSEGYHILYKSKRVQGNTKIATLKGHKEAIIETRGVGGYIFVYPDNQVSKRSYFDIDYISDNDREILFYVSKLYNHIEEKVDEPEKRKTDYAQGEITPWEDYNNKTSVWDLVQDEFSIPTRGNKSKWTLIKRQGATSPHSGYIFKNNGFMYLFSTGTIYPHEKLLTPFMVYAYKFHSGDFKAAASDLYNQGYGSRIKKQPPKPLIESEIIDDKIEINKDDLVFPIDIFPKPIQNYMLECATKLNSNIDFMGCSLIWAISVSVGNCINVEIKRGWVEAAPVWLALIGKPGVGKTPSINNIIFPLEKINSREIKKYYKELEKYDFYKSLSDKEKKDYPEVEKPLKTQFIANDITLEALVDMHQESDNSVGVFKDEISGWLKDMNKYREGSDKEFWLSCWSCKSVSLNRITRKGSFVDRPFIPVLGGIQPDILNSFYTEENKANGFMDRLLMTYPEASVEYYNENEIEPDVIEWYKDNIVGFYDTIKSIIDRDFDGAIEPKIARFDIDAKKKWIEFDREITDKQNSMDENEYLKSMYPKQKSYIPRFALLIHVFNDYFNANGNALLISEESILKAKKLSDYFVMMAKRIKLNSIEISDMKNILNSGSTTTDKIASLYAAKPDFNRSEASEILGVSRRTIQRILDKISANVTPNVAVNVAVNVAPKKARK